MDYRNMTQAELIDMIDMFIDFPRMRIERPDEAAAVQCEQSRRVAEFKAKQAQVRLGKAVERRRHNLDLLMARHVHDFIPPSVPHRQVDMNIEQATEVLAQTMNAPAHLTGEGWESGTAYEYHDTPESLAPLLAEALAAEGLLVTDEQPTADLHISKAGVRYPASIPHYESGNPELLRDGETLREGWESEQQQRLIRLGKAFEQVSARWRWDVESSAAAFRTAVYTESLDLT